MTSTRTEVVVPLRIVVLRPPPGVAFAVQRGRFELLQPSAASAEALAFELEVRIAPKTDGAPNVLGPFAQGTQADRFIYVNSGTSAGQLSSPWTRRAKVRTGGIGWELVDALLGDPGAVLEARFEGTAKDGTPACASVKLVDGWRVARATA